MANDEDADISAGAGLRVFVKISSNAPLARIEEEVVEPPRIAGERDDTKYSEEITFALAPLGELDVQGSRRKLSL